MKYTQNDYVLDMLRDRRDGITAMDALGKLGVARLAARISELRDAGHWIDTQMIEVPTRCGTARVARYRLINEKGDHV